jgi:carboxyl-terminal processing protease
MKIITRIYSPAASRSSDGHPALRALRARLCGAAQAGVGVAAAAALLLTSPASADVEQLAFPVSPDPSIFAVQRTLVEAWTIVTEAFVDQTFNGADWRAELSARLIDAAASQSPQAAEGEIKEMLKTLGDPYTRWVPPQEYRNFRVGNDGELQGIGLLIASDPSSGRLVVLAPLQGGPAERAGVKPGDEVVAVDGRPTSGWDSETAAQKLRGRQGSDVVLEVSRRVEIPGVAGSRPAEDSVASDPESVVRKRFRLRREVVELSPVFATTMHHDDKTFGYVRLVNFSQRAAGDMLKAIKQLEVGMSVLFLRVTQTWNLRVFSEFRF